MGRSIFKSLQLSYSLGGQAPVHPEKPLVSKQVKPPWGNFDKWTQDSVHEDDETRPQHMRCVTVVN
jgi:hypothetical protein